MAKGVKIISAKPRGPAGTSITKMNNPTKTGGSPMPVFIKVISVCLPLKLKNARANERGMAVRAARIVAVPDTFMETPVMLRI
jgi:hypothetical protein